MKNISLHGVIEMKISNFVKMNRLYFSYIILVFLIMPIFLFSQTEQPAFNYSLGTAQFRGPEKQTCLELYFSIFRQALTFVTQEDSTLKAGFNVATQVYQADSLVSEKNWNNISYAKSDSEITKNQQLFSTMIFYLTPGEYRFVTKIQDTYSDKNSQKEFKQYIRPFSDSELNISDMEFAFSLRRDTTKSQFYKNGYRIIPNPAAFYGIGLPVLFFYAEVYNLKYISPDDTSQYLVHRRVLDGQGQVVRDFGKKAKRKPGTSVVEVGGVNIITLKSGTYFFDIQVTDLANEATTEIKRKFFVYREGDFADAKATKPKPIERPVTPEIFTDTRYTTMIEKEIDEEFESTRYISDNEERKIYKKLKNKEGKQQFMINFWKKRDQQPETKKNEFRDLYLSRVSYANEHFTGFKKGWKTDRGRVLLIYGEPDEIERAPFSSENKPFEIWKYFAIQGGVEFYFVDKRGFGTMELVHSTARAELNDPNWQRWITTGTEY